MTTPEHHDINYFRQRIKSRHRDDLADMQRCIAELEQIIKGIDKGLEILKTHGKYPDQKVLDNKKDYRALLIEFNEYKEK